jgi:threonine/homoserine/homoserine lactone efflux protein
MLEMLTAAFAIGVLIALSPGVIMIATVQRTCCYGFRNAAVFNIGVTASDLLFLLLVYGGLHLLLQGNVMLNFILFILSGCWLIWMGISTVRQQLQIEQSPERQADHSDWKNFNVGFVMNLLNPLTIIGWAAIAGNFFSHWGLNWPPMIPYGLVACATMLVGVLAWQVVLILLLCAIRDLMQPLVLSTLSVVGGTFLLCCGLMAWHNALELMGQVLA